MNEPTRCAGCGSSWTDDALAEARRAIPAILSCCPERQPLTIDQWKARAEKAETDAAALQAERQKPVTDLTLAAYRLGQERMRDRAARVNVDRAGREWVRESLWGRIATDLAAKIEALPIEDKMT